jgi:peptide/nickel transport system permease protein
VTGLGALVERSGSLVTGAVLMILVVGLAVLAPILAPFDPYAGSGEAGVASLRPPRAPNHLGTDLLGRDVLSRLLYGARVSLLVGFGSGALAATLGLVVGLAAGYWGGVLDGLLMRVADVVTAFPSLVLAIAVVVLFDVPGLGTAILVLAGIGWAASARVVRGRVLVLRSRDFLAAGRALGVSGASLVVRHLVPQLAGPVVATVTMGVASAVAAEAGLSFLGLGAQPPTISWGTMLAEGQSFLTVAPWVAFFPGLALMLTVLGINLLGDGLRDVLDRPRRAAADHGPAAT